MKRYKRDLEYKLQVATAKRIGGLPRHIHILALSCAAIVGTLVLALPSSEPVGHDPTAESSLREITQIPLDLPNPSATALSQGSMSQGSNLSDKAPIGRWHTTTIRSGDTLSRVFSRLGIRAKDLYAVLSSGPEAKGLTQVRPGQVFKICHRPDGELLELGWETDKIHGTRIVREGDGFRTLKYTHKVEKRTGFVTGTIRNSLYQSALNAGLSDRLIMKMAEIFGWDIDFALDIRPGDRFAVIYEEDYVAGEKVGNGDILAAEFINQGKNYRAVRYTNLHGITAYYTPEGRAMRQAFLRSPVDFRRISSHFQRSRWHPVLGKKRPHRGVDYAAAIGTPIQASGDGKVIFIGRKGGYGKTVILKHYKRYTTLYGHMSRFKKGLRRGSYVKQGEIIGYVGKTGLATGPHLHYEFRIDGVHHNPVTVKLPGSPPIERRYRADFHAKTSTVLAQLDLVSRTTQLAMNFR